MITININGEKHSNAKKQYKNFKDHRSGFVMVVIFDNECGYSAVRLFSERCINQKSIAGIGCGGRI